MTKVLCFSTLYPNGEQPNHGIFVENRLRHTVLTGTVTATVLAPVPFFPFRSKAFGRYGAFARVARQETRHEIPVYHPRFPVIPKLGQRWTPHFLYKAARRKLEQLVSDGYDFDVIDAHYFYPDAVAAGRLARQFGKPFVVTSRGSDLTEHARDPAQRELILQTASAATALITVSASLKAELERLGVDPDRIAVLRNGVETDTFRPLPRDECRKGLGLDAFTILSVGALIPLKAHDIAIRSLVHMPDCHLLIAGIGPLHGELERLAGSLGVASRVTLLGAIPHRELATYYSAADAMVLMSSREGWANVILESLACGTPVVASDVGGVREIIRDPVAGMIVTERQPESLAAAISRLRAALPSRVATRRYAEAFGWEPVASANARLLTAASRSTQPMKNVASDFTVHGPQSPT